jgi:hypothetical protein
MKTGKNKTPKMVVPWWGRCISDHAFSRTETAVSPPD